MHRDIWARMMRLPPAKWQQLRQAHGNCSHMPNAIADLFSSDATVREKARWQIDNHVVVQGDLYEGAPWVAQALVHRLPMADDDTKIVVYDLLMELLLGFAPDSDTIQVKGRDIPLREATGAAIAAGRTTFLVDSKRSDRHGLVQLAGELVEELDDRGL